METRLVHEYAKRLVRISDICSYYIFFPNECPAYTRAFIRGKICGISPKKAAKKEDVVFFVIFENLDQCTGLLVRQIEINQCFSNIWLRL